MRELSGRVLLLVSDGDEARSKDPVAEETEGELGEELQPRRERGFAADCDELVGSAVRVYGSAANCWNLSSSVLHLFKGECMARGKAVLIACKDKFGAE